MAGRVKPENLVGVSEIATRLGCSVTVVHSWRRRDLDFPEPLAELRMGLVWDWPEVASWAQRTNRLPEL